MEEPAATDGLVRFRIVITVGPVRATASRLRLVAALLVAVTDAVRPWRDRPNPDIVVSVENDLVDDVAGC